MIDELLDDAARWSVPVPAAEVRAVMSRHAGTCSPTSAVRRSSTPTSGPGTCSSTRPPARCVGRHRPRARVLGRPAGRPRRHRPHGPRARDARRCSTGYGPLDVDSPSARTRLDLYRMRLCLVMMIEITPRKFEGDWVEPHRSAVTANLHAALASLRLTRGRPVTAADADGGRHPRVGEDGRMLPLRLPVRPRCRRRRRARRPRRLLRGRRRRPGGVPVGLLDPDARAADVRGGDGRADRDAPAHRDRRALRRVRAGLSRGAGVPRPARRGAGRHGGRGRPLAPSPTLPQCGNPLLGDLRAASLAGHAFAVGDPVALPVAGGASRAIEVYEMPDADVGADRRRDGGRRPRRLGRRQGDAPGGQRGRHLHAADRHLRGRRGRGGPARLDGVGAHARRGVVPGRRQRRRRPLLRGAPLGRARRPRRPRAGRRRHTRPGCRDGPRHRHAVRPGPHRPTEVRASPTRADDGWTAQHPGGHPWHDVARSRTCSSPSSSPPVRGTSTGSSATASTPWSTRCAGRARTASTSRGCTCGTRRPGRSRRRPRPS